ncbi:MAG: tetratricopeptide repeat protein [Desulfovibrio sp.]|nr:tetratricopeptide repeat protein [Desulfovibrio sp.]
MPVFAAETPESLSSGQISGSVLTPQNVRFGVNPGGPENWPENLGISTTVSPVEPGSSAPPSRPVQGPSIQEQPVHEEKAALPALPLPPQSPSPEQKSASVQIQSESQPRASSGEAQSASPSERDMGTRVDGAVRETLLNAPSDKAESPEAPHEVIYVDEKGNPVPKPPEPDKMLANAKSLLEGQKIDEALSELEKIRNLPDLETAMREEVLYLISDCLWSKYASNPLAGYEAIVASASEAMNANLRSPRVPDALLRLALSNMHVGNMEEAEGYATALYRRYPDYPGVAQGFTALGKERLKRKLYQQAEQHFSMVLDRYPDSPFLEEASLGQARSLFALKKYEQADVILDFLGKRWPRGYLADPGIILLQAENAVNLGKTAQALEHYWLYINLNPEQQGNDRLMLTMGDMYFRQGNTNAAFFLYRETERRFAKSYAAAIARLRLAEKGIYEEPVTYQRMSRVFAEESEPSLLASYNALAGLSKTEPESVLVRLKLPLLFYWNKDYVEAMGGAADFIDLYPEHPGTAEARDIIWQAFQKELANDLTEQNYSRVLSLWNAFPLVRERYGPLDSRLRFALAQGWFRHGDDEKALELLTEFLKTPMEPQYSEAAFMEFFNRYLTAGNWKGILDLGDLAANWDLPSQLRSQLDYALALAAQNLNLAAPALAIWKKLAERTDIPLYQRAYAVFFLARDAEQRKDIQGAYERNRQVIELFSQLRDERSDKADPQRIKEAISSLMDICEVDNRVPEALDWLAKYNAFVAEDSPEYSGLRFREARLYRKLGDATRAKALLEDIVKRFPGSPFGKAAASELHTFEVSRDLREYMPGGDRASGAQR